MRQGLWGYSSTIVRILQWGVGGVLPGRMVLLWPAPSFNGGFGLACAAIPPAPPSNVFQDRGTPPVPRRGLRPLHPAWGMEGAAFSPSAGYGGRDKMRLLDGWSCCGQRCPSTEGSVWPAPLSHLPTLQRFWRQGDSPCTPGGNQGFPAPSFEETGEASAQHCGGHAVSPAGAAPPAPRLGEEEGIVAKRDIARPTPVIARA